MSIRARALHLSTINADLLDYCELNYIDDDEITLNIAKIDGLNALRYIHLSNIKNIALAAVNNNGMSLYFASNRLKSDFEVCMAAVSNNGLALQYVSNVLRSNFEVCMVAVSNNGLTLQYVSDVLRSNFEVCMVAVSNDGLALQYASDELKSDINIVSTAVTNNGLALTFAAEELKHNKLIISLAIRTCSVALYLTSDDMFKDETLIIQSFKKLDEDLLLGKKPNPRCHPGYITNYVMEISKKTPSLIREILNTSGILFPKFYGKIERGWVLVQMPLPGQIIDDILIIMF